MGLVTSLTEPPIIVLVLHRVGNPTDFNLKPNQDLSIPLESLKQFITSAQSSCDFVSLTDAILLSQAPARRDRSAIALTFDDGYSSDFFDFHNYALTHNIPYTLFPTTDFIYRRRIPWWLALDLVLSLPPDPDFPFTLKSNTPIDNFFYVRDLILSDKPSYLLFDTYIRNRYELYSHLLDLFLSSSELSLISSSSLVEIGSHTLSHLPTSFHDVSEFEHEINSSRTILQELTHKTITHFAYPYGLDLYSASIQHNILLSSGFNTVVTTEGGYLSSAYKLTDPVPRLPLSSNTTFQSLQIQCLKLRIKKLLSDLFH